MKAQTKEQVIDADLEKNGEHVIDVDKESAENEKKRKKDGSNKGSWVWEYFSYINGSNNTKVKCSFCPTKISAGSRTHGTSSMSYHLKNVSKRSRVYKKKGYEKTNHFEPKAQHFGGWGSLAFQSFSQEKARKSLARMCIKDNRPFSVVDDEGLREFI
ncbi:uncharacterized protein [Rutidosis leptorrhynchoides]|uniref:uncharacterized protein n=1 Tax=Rutidosis leptorrhynchoides TaxID=125765 RepID=UPI003A990C3F